MGTSERERRTLRRHRLIQHGIEIHANGKPVAQHGTRARYVSGCRCDDCRDASRTYHQRRGA